MSRRSIKQRRPMFETERPPEKSNGITIVLVVVIALAVLLGVGWHWTRP
jgi:hypothetical protein